MQPKRIITLLLVVVLTFICGVTSVAAQDNAAETLEIAVEATSSTAVMSEPLCVKAGETLDVSVAIKANPGVTVLNIALNYDVNALTPKTDAEGNLEVKYGKFFADFEQVKFNPETGVVEYLGRVADYTSFNPQVVTETGNLFTVTFTVKEDYHGDSPLTLSGYEKGIISKFNPIVPTVFDGNTKDYNKATVSSHLWGEPKVVKATCTTDGTTNLTCTDDTCKKEVTRIDQTAIGHTPVVDAAKEPTCTEIGLTEGSHCSVCGEILVNQEEIPAKGHSYGEWEVEKEATKKEEGLKVKTCSACGDKITETIPKLEGSSAWIWILVVALVVVLGGGGFCLYWFVLRKKK